MSRDPSAIWSDKLPKTVWAQLRQIIDSANNRDTPLEVFFRADDIAITDTLFSKLMEIFLAHEMPLCLAVVPDWFDTESWVKMKKIDPENPLWCWHQHGKNHVNHETEGKKCEFGDTRSTKAIRNDLTKGKKVLSTILGELFYPVFTPPWNRCGKKTLKALHESGFKAVSRSRGAKPSAHDIIPDLAINVDLHTRRESDFSAGWQNLLTEFAEAADSGRMGIMIHHQLMNEEAFAFLDLLLPELRTCQNINCGTFRDLL